MVNNGNGHQLHNKEIERQARLLAREARHADPAISRIFWFPDEQEVRLVEIDDTVPPNHDKKIHPFFFRPSPQDDLPSPSATALIRPEEVRQIDLPSAWGNWDDGIEIEAAE
jgi:hypothetical protein